MDAATLDKIEAATEAAAGEKDTRNWCPPSVARQLIDALREAQRERDAAVEGRAFYVQQFEHERVEVNRLGALVAQTRAALMADFVPTAERIVVGAKYSLIEIVQHAVEHHRWHHDAERVDYVRGLEDRVLALEGALRRFWEGTRCRHTEVNECHRCAARRLLDRTVSAPQTAVTVPARCGERLGASACMLPPHAEGMHEWWTREEPREYIAWNMHEGAVVQVRQGTFIGNASKLAWHTIEAYGGGERPVMKIDGVDALAPEAPDARKP